jgi:hypothetical protein
LLLLELLRDELELEVFVGRVRDFVEVLELERLTLVRERVELERLTRDFSVERLTLVRERVELEFEVVLLYCRREALLELDENDRFEEGVVRLYSGVLRRVSTELL